MYTTSITRAAWALGTWGVLVANLAQANLWWEAPALKYDERLVGSTASDPHYMGKDEADQHLAMVTGSGGGTAYLYSIPALTAAASDGCNGINAWQSWASASAGMLGSSGTSCFEAVKYCV